MICSEATIASNRAILARKLSVYLKDKGKDVVMCVILKGAAFFAVDLSRDLQDLGLEHSMYFVDASSYRGIQQADAVTVKSLLMPDKFKGKHVLLVDELYDNGKTLATVYEHLLADICMDAKDVTTCVMFRKTKNVTQYAPPDFVGLDVEDAWLVGYGLDDDGLRRGMRDLAAKI